jgi:hypothetical protein
MACPHGYENADYCPRCQDEADGRSMREGKGAAELERLQAENARLQQWVADCQSGMYVNCVYCGHRYGPEDEVPVAMAEVLKQHIAICPKHPMSALLECCKGAWYALGSLLAIREGMSDEALSDLRDSIQAAVIKAGGKL